MAVNCCRSLSFVSGFLSYGWWHVVVSSLVVCISSRPSM